MKLPSSIASDLFRRDKKSRLQSVADELEIPLQKVLVANRKGLWMINEWLPSRNISSLDLFRTWTTDKKSLTKLNERFVVGDRRLVEEITETADIREGTKTIIASAQVPNDAPIEDVVSTTHAFVRGTQAQASALINGKASHSRIEVTPDNVMMSYQDANTKQVYQSNAPTPMVATQASLISSLATMANKVLRRFLFVCFLSRL